MELDGRGKSNEFKNKNPKLIISVIKM